MAGFITLLTPSVAFVAIIIVTSLFQQCNGNARNSIAQPERRSFCKYRSKYVKCNGMGNSFALHLVSRTAKMMSLNDNQLRALEPRIMRRFKNLEFLEVSHNNIHTFRGSLVRNKNLVRIVANDNKLGVNMGVHQGALKGVFRTNTKLQSASLRQNGIIKLSSIIVDYRNNSLHNLDVAENKIERITSHTVAGLGKLEKLDLHKNKIIYVHRGAFRKNLNLDYLDLRDNFISFRGPNSHLNLKNNKHLNVLLISNNKLLSLTEVDLSRNRELKILDVAYNRLSMLDQNSLGYNVKLIQLNASYNHIRTINPGSFRRQTILQKLDLSNNLISNLHQHTFINLKKLQVLSLANNLLTSLYKDLFVGNIWLQFIDLSGNLLSAWKPCIIQGNIHLNTLDLSDNKFDVVSPNYFTNNADGNEFYIGNWAGDFVEESNVEESNELDEFDVENEEGNAIRTIHSRRAKDRFENLDCLRMSGNPMALKAFEATLTNGIRFIIGRRRCSVTYEDGNVKWECGCHGDDINSIVN